MRNYSCVPHMVCENHLTSLTNQPLPTNLYLRFPRLI
jgi:transcriptional regulator of met regulon